MFPKAGSLISLYTDLSRGQGQATTRPIYLMGGVDSLHFPNGIDTAQIVAPLPFYS